MNTAIEILKEELSLNMSLIKSCSNDLVLDKLNRKIYNIEESIKRIEEGSIESHLHSFLQYLNDCFSLNGESIQLYDGTIKTEKEIINEFYNEINKQSKPLSVSSKGFTKDEWNKLSVGSKFKSPVGNIRTVTKVEHKSGYNRRGVHRIHFETGATYEYSDLYKNYQIVK